MPLGGPVGQIGKIIDDLIVVLPAQMRRIGIGIVQTEAVEWTPIRIEDLYRGAALTIFVAPFGLHRGLPRHMQLAGFGVVEPVLISQKRSGSDEMSLRPVALKDDTREPPLSLQLVESP